MENDKIGFFAKLKQGLVKTKSSFSEKLDNIFAGFTKIDDDLFDELEEILISADVGIFTTMKIIENLREKVKKGRITDPLEVQQALIEIVTDIMQENDSSMNLNTKPSIIIVIGVNGVGKTTSIGKLAVKYRNMGKNVLLAAADTFRAAAIEQLEIWATRSDVDIIKHEEGSDPSAVIFDAIAAAKSRNTDIIICDTAGRLHTKKNLMEELKKIFRIIERELPNADKEVLLVLDATTGQNAIIQAKQFGDAIGISGLVLTKLDGTAKGGVVIGLQNEQKIPVKFIGVGEKIDDLQMFDASEFSKALFEK